MIQNDSETDICLVDSKQMSIDGYSVYHNDQDEWLMIDSIPAQYILPILIETKEDVDIVAKNVQYRSII